MADSWRLKAGSWRLAAGYNPLVSETDVTARLAAMESQIEELKSVQELLLRLLSTSRPISKLLEYYGATDTNEQSLYKLLDELVERIRGPKFREPTFGSFGRPTATFTASWLPTAGPSGTKGDTQSVPLVVVAYSTPADPPKIPLMVWFFHRGREHLRVETRRSRSGEFILILHQADGTQLVDRFKSQGKFRKRLHDLERKLARARWMTRSAADSARSER